jgi:aryl-alcohol dehydrogenase-like predicted oxidoreductase
LALAWALANKDVSVLLFGASRLEQVDENLKAVEVLKKWNKEIEQKIEALLQNTPESELNFRTYKPA